MGLIHEEESYAILGACFDVYTDLGSGFLESVYQEALALELDCRQIPFHEQAKLSIHYKARELSQKYFADFLCFGKVILELKAVKKIAAEHRAQLHNYLKASGHQLGFLLNFGHHPKLEYERIVL